MSSRLPNKLSKVAIRCTSSIVIIFIFGIPSPLKNLPKILLLLLVCICFTASAQDTFRAIVKADGEDADTLAGALALVVGTEISGLADSNGLVVLSNIPNGDQQIEVSFIGYFKKRFKVKRGMESCP